MTDRMLNFSFWGHLENMRLSHGAFVGDVFAVQLVRLNNKQDLVLAGKLKRLRQHFYI